MFFSSFNLKNVKFRKTDTLSASSFKPLICFIYIRVRELYSTACLVYPEEKPHKLCMQDGREQNC